jgi:nitrogen fixation/metabolism regulation signal transduction histidine kinase
MVLMEDRELLERIDRHMERQTGVMEAMVQTLGAIGRALDDVRADLRALAGEIREHRAEGRAHTEALLRLMDRIDRLDPGGSAA